MALTIVMYHYVRDLARYPGIKGRDTASFQRQLDYIESHHTVVTAEEVIAAAKGGPALPDNALWLTFDDGYADHYNNVFPLLQERDWQGSFFPPARAIENRELLDVNQIHFILAATQDHEAIIKSIRAFIDERQGCDGIRSFADYSAELVKPTHLDNANVAFIKDMLQWALPSTLRSELLKHLFKRFVRVEPSALAAELYMSTAQLQTLIQSGMYVGSHGAGHYWLDRLSPADQETEIDAARAFLRRLGAPTEDWIMCYPYGAWNDGLVNLLKTRGCSVGITTESNVADLGVHDPLKLPRLDTNDLPH